MDAELLTIVPPEMELLTVAINVTVADWPAGREANETVRLLPVPPHVPPPVEEQEIKDSCAGRLSVTTMS